jgi:hypothetical protein
MCHFAALTAGPDDVNFSGTMESVEAHDSLSLSLSLEGVKAHFDKIQRSVTSRSRELPTVLDWTPRRAYTFDFG